MASDLNDESTIGPWLMGLKGGDNAAVERLWKNFFEPLVQAAERRLRNSPPQLLVDGEDVAASALICLWKGIQQGRFSKIRELDQLWWTLLRITRQKCIDHIRRASTERRGGKVDHVSLNQPLNNERDLFDFLVLEAPDAQYLAVFEEEFQRLINLLSDPKQREIAVLRIEGYSSEEIAAKLNVSLSTVNRKLKIIRKTWSRGGTDESSTGPVR